MNDGGETPYQIDLGNKKSILTQIFGTKSLSEPKQGSNDLSQYDLYSSALADILSEPTMVPPLTVGVYAQWGSGKSFLLKKLQDIMESFVGETGLEEFRLSVWWFLPLVIVLSWACGLVSIFVRDDKGNSSKIPNIQIKYYKAL
jgi:ankyrin repeat-rich membrane spanning protein